MGGGGTETQSTILQQRSTSPQRGSLLAVGTVPAHNLSDSFSDFGLSSADQSTAFSLSFSDKLTHSYALVCRCIDPRVLQYSR